MTKEVFLKTEIKDNNNFFDGIPLATINTGNLYKTESTSENKKRLRLEVGLFKFMQELYLKFASSNINDFTNRTIFGEEFDANEEQKFFDFKGDCFDNARICTYNLVGSVFYKGQTFAINSRFGDDFLKYMIASSNGLLEFENAGGLDKELSLAEWIFIYYFKLKLKDAFGLGIYKKYALKQEDLLSIRGQIDINHLIKKGYFDGKTRCKYNEHSYSNGINYIISLAINKVFKSKKYKSIVEDIHTIKNAFNQIEYKRQNIGFLRNEKVKNPFYKKYDEVFKSAYKILNDDFGSTGEEENFSAFLFDISLLFEHHIRSLLKTKFNLGIKNTQDFKIPNGNKGSNIFPDIVIYNNDGTISIYDVKYKNFGYEVNGDDRYQLISYVAVYSQKYKVRECGFIYPSNNNEINKENEILKICNEEIAFKIIFYNIAKETNNEKNTFFINQKIEDDKFIDVFSKKEKTNLQASDI